MATKKDVTETKEVKKAKANEDNGLVDVFIPMDYSNPDEKTQYVAVNGVAILVPKGRRVKVKPEYAQAIAISQSLTEAKYLKEEEARAKAGQEFINTSY